MINVDESDRAILLWFEEWDGGGGDWQPFHGFVWRCVKSFDAQRWRMFRVEILRALSIREQILVSRNTVMHCTPIL